MDSIIWNHKNAKNKILLLGSEFPLKLNVELQSIGELDDPIIVSGISAGYKITVKKTRSNEDGCGVVIDGQLKLLILGDSHFGGIFLDAVIISFVNYYNDYKNNLINLKSKEDFKEVIDKRLNFAVDEILPELKKDNQPIGETTLIIVFIDNNDIFYASIGDSAVYKFGEKSFKLNNDNFYFLEKNLLNINKFEYDKLQYSKDEIILIASDGLPGIYGAPSLDIIDLQFHLDKNLNTFSKNLINFTFSKGCEDNLALILTKL